MFENIMFKSIKVLFNDIFWKCVTHLRIRIQQLLPKPVKVILIQGDLKSSRNELYKAASDETNSTNRFLHKG